MGAWGTGPFDNDAAGDWFDDVDRYLLKKIGETLESGDVDNLTTVSQWYAAAALLAGVDEIKYGSYGRSEESVLAVQRLDEIIEAAPGMGWKDAARFVRDVRKVKDRLVEEQRRLRARRSKRRTRQQKALT